MEALLIALVVLVAGIGLAVLLLRRFGPSGFDAAYETQKAPDYARAATLAEFGRLTSGGYRITSQTAAGMTLERRFRPVWLIFPIVLLFPLGLLSLLYKQTYTVTVSLIPQGRGTRVTVTGFGPNSLRDFADSTAAYMASE